MGTSKYKTIRLVLLLMMVSPLTGCHLREPQRIATDLRRVGLIGRVQAVRVETATISSGNGDSMEVSRGLTEMTKFDPEGKQTEEVYYGAEESPLLKVEYTYDASGSRVEKATYTPNGTLKERESYANDSRGQAVESSKYKPGGLLHSKSDYTYDDQGHETDWVLYNARGAMIDHWVYTYDEDGKKTEEARYYADGSLDARCVYNFDGRAMPVQSIKYNASGMDIEEQRYVYEFDSKGNWTKKTTLRRMGTSKEAELAAAEIISRFITYY